MKDRKLAIRYARALLSTYPDPNAAVDTDLFLQELAKAMRGSSEFRNFLLDPAYSRDDRKKVLGSLVEQAGVPAKVGRFVDLLVDKNRIAALPSIAAVFHEERETAMGIVPAEIVTASPMTDEMTRRAQSAMERMTGRKIRLACNVDPALIGGAVTKIGSTVHDGSLRTQLAKLRSKMAQE